MRAARPLAPIALILAASWPSPARGVGPPDARPAFATEAVRGDADDPAIWVHPTDPSRSLILGTDKVAAPVGALHVFGIDGARVQEVGGIDRPNNVDVEYGLELGGKPVDIAVLTERGQRRLRAFAIDPDSGRLEDRSLPEGLAVFEGEPGDSSRPMGIALYRRPRDGAIFAIVSRKTGPRDGYLWQYRLRDDGEGRVAATKVCAFGRFGGKGEIEAVAVDDALGAVFYADERDGIHKYRADPDAPDADVELAHFGLDGFRGDREGIAIYALPDGTGLIACTDQVDGDSATRLFRREGEPGRPHDHSRLVGVVKSEADATDGLEITPADLGPRFPRGVVVAMNSKGKDFFVYEWGSFLNAAVPPKAGGD